MELEMKRWILIFFLALVSPDVLSQNLDSVKCWSERDRLRWADFKGKIPEDESMNAASSLKLNVIPFEKNDMLNYRVQITFKKYESWKTDTAEYLLSHEQLHFDITELYARKLRKVIQEVLKRPKKPTKQDFQSFIRKLYLENSVVHDEYDRDTANGIIADSQAKWAKKIHLELEQLRDYASTLADCE